MTIIGDANPFKEAKEQAGEYIQMLFEAVTKARQFQERNIRTGPGRHGLYTEQQAMLKSRKTRVGKTTHRPVKPGTYLNKAYAERAMRRFARWMAANPQAKTHREAPFHIGRNAARAQEALR